MSENCEKCGKDHQAALLENMEEFALIERAIEVVEEEHPEESPLSESAVFLFRQLTDMTIHNSVEAARKNGINVIESTELAVSTVMMKVFMAGVATSHHFAESLPIPNVFVTEEIVNERREWLSNVIDAASHPDSIPAKIAEFLASLGIDTDQVKIVGVDELPNLTKKEGDTGHGMYL